MRSARTEREAAPDQEAPIARRRGTEAARAAMGRAARELAYDYFDFWSARNAVALEVVPDFYGDRVRFHGRDMSAQALFAEKRRFVRRWPERDYRHRPESMRVACDPADEICRVRSTFDFVAANPSTGRRSQGTGIVELVISLADGQPEIVGETSRVASRGRGGSREEDFDE